MNGAPKKDRLRLVIYTWFFKIFQCGIRVVAPQVFELVDLGIRDLTGAKLFRLTRRLDEPR